VGRDGVRIGYLFKIPTSVATTGFNIRSSGMRIKTSLPQKPVGNHFKKCSLPAPIRHLSRIPQAATSRLKRVNKDFGLTANGFCVKLSESGVLSGYMTYIIQFNPEGEATDLRSLPQVFLDYRKDKNHIVRLSHSLELVIETSGDSFKLTFVSKKIPLAVYYEIILNLLDKQNLELDADLDAGHFSIDHVDEKTFKNILNLCFILRKNGDFQGPFIEIANILCTRIYLLALSKQKTQDITAALKRTLGSSTEEAAFLRGAIFIKSMRVRDQVQNQVFAYIKRMQGEIDEACKQLERSARCRQKPLKALFEKYILENP